MTPILLLELNEVPWRLVDRYAGHRECARLQSFLAQARQLTTVAVDTGELSPWVTWPTLHRGVNNESHGIRNLGQDPATFSGTPIWQEIRARGGSIGVFGSLQSWPPVDPGEGGFYVPDTFASDDRCYPEALRPLQGFNLEQVRRNARVVDATTPRAREALALARHCRLAGVRYYTLARLAAQVASERVDAARAARRPIFQTVLLWDAFRRQFDAARPPAFSTFFTNHVAGVMHRCWQDVFPEDFSEAPGRAPQEHLMRFALRVLDDMLGDVMAWTRRNPSLVVVLAASMGQGPVHRRRHEGFELVVEDLARLMAAAGVERAQYRALLAMVPQVAVEITDARTRAEAARKLRSARFGETHFIGVQEHGATLSITVSTPSLASLEPGAALVDGVPATLAELGVRRQAVEPGTGYHVPEGMLAVRAEGVGADHQRQRVDADRVKEWLLRVSAAGPAQVASLAAAPEDMAA